jgi:SAM-dependent methyltransferase
LTRADLTSEGLKVFRDLVEAAEAQPGEFQVVTLFQVLEHLSEFDLVLTQCRRLLAPGGRLVITVPDGDAMIRQERLTGCADMPPNHISKWTSTSLGHVLSRAGFEVIGVIPEPASWRNIVASIHLKVMADATKADSLAARAYSISNKQLRIVALATLGIPALLQILSNWKSLSLGGAFAMIAQAGK